jgi:hypothetical protein
VKQSVLASWIETIASTATGFLLSLVLQYVVCWWYALELKLQDNLAIIALFTVASLVRGFFWRRLMERLHVRNPLSAGALAIVAERRRQIEQEGWTPEHDLAHPRGSLARHGACYALHADARRDAAPPSAWGWDAGWWKPDGYRRNLVKAGALILAELDCDDYARKRQTKR